MELTRKELAKHDDFAGLEWRHLRRALFIVEPSD